MEFKIIGLAHGPLLGFQYIDKEDEDDWAEFNIYLLLICLSWKFY
jgi:hypothetical protein